MSKKLYSYVLHPGGLGFDENIRDMLDSIRDGCNIISSESSNGIFIYILEKQEPRESIKTVKPSEQPGTPTGRI